MSKGIGYAIVWTVGILMMLPLLFIAYGITFGYSFATMQINAAVGLAIVGVSITALGSLIVSDMSW